MRDSPLKGAGMRDQDPPPLPDLVLGSDHSMTAFAKLASDCFHTLLEQGIPYFRVVFQQKLF